MGFYDQQCDEFVKPKPEPAPAPQMEPGYYWYKTTHESVWRIVKVSNGMVHFFGDVSQKLGNEYLTKYGVFGPRIEQLQCNSAMSK